MTSEQAAYHTGLDQVRAELAAQVQLAEIARQTAARGEDLMSEAEQAWDGLIGSLAAAVRQSREKLTVSTGQAHDKAVAAERKFHSAFSDLTERIVLQVIAAGLSEWVAQTKGTMGQTVAYTDGLKQNADQAVAAPNDIIDPVATDVSSLPSRCQEQQNQAMELIQQIDAQRRNT